MSEEIEKIIDTAMYEVVHKVGHLSSEDVDIIRLAMRNMLLDVWDEAYDTGYDEGYNDSDEDL